jgi:L1 cell adhesion molecule like protein
MVKEAEKYKAEDDANKNRIEAKNALENYCFSLKSSISSDELRNKLSSNDIKSLEDAVVETTTWLDKHPDADKGAFDSKRDELQKLALPLLQKAAGGAGDMPAGGFQPDMNGNSPMNDPASGPTIEEID